MKEYMVNLDIFVEAKDKDEVRKIVSKLLSCDKVVAVQKVIDTDITELDGR